MNEGAEELVGAGHREGAGRGRAGQFGRLPAPPRPASCRSSEAPPRPAPPLHPQAAVARSRCRSRCPRGGCGAASGSPPRPGQLSPPPGPAAPAGQLAGPGSPPAPAPPGPASRRVHEVDATLLHLEGRTYGRGRCAGCGPGWAPTWGRAGGGSFWREPGAREGAGPDRYRGRVCREAAPLPP